MDKDFEFQLRIEKNDDKSEQVRAECRELCDLVDEQGYKHELARYFNGEFEDFYVLATHGDDDKIIGAMAMNSSYDTAQGHLKRGNIYINATVVAPEFQGRGVSRAMFNYLEEHLDGFKLMQTSVRAENEASRRSREKQGFAVTREWESGEQKGVFMARPVEPTRATKRWEDAEPEMR